VFLFFSLACQLLHHTVSGTHTFLYCTEPSWSRAFPQQRGKQPTNSSGEFQIAVWSEKLTSRAVIRALKIISITFSTIAVEMATCFVWLGASVISVLCLTEACGNWAFCYLFCTGLVHAKPASYVYSNRLPDRTLNTLSGLQLTGPARFAHTLEPQLRVLLSHPKSCFNLFSILPARCPFSQRNS